MDLSLKQLPAFVGAVWVSLLILTWKTLEAMFWLIGEDE